MKNISGALAVIALVGAAGCVHGAGDRSSDSPATGRSPDPVSIAMVPVSSYDAGTSAAAWDAAPMAEYDAAPQSTWDSGASPSKEGAKTVATAELMDAGAAAYEAGR